MNRVTHSLHNAFKSCMIILLILLSTTACNPDSEENKVNISSTCQDEVLSFKGVPDSEENKVNISNTCQDEVLSFKGVPCMINKDDSGIRLEITNKYSRPIDLKHIQLCIIPTEAYLKKTNSTTCFILLIPHNILNITGSCIPDHRSMHGAYPFKKSAYMIPSQGKVMLQIGDDTEDEGYWRGVPIRLQLTYLDRAYLIEVVHP